MGGRMTKLLSTAVFGFSMFVLAGCVQQTGQEVTRSAPVPLTSAQIQSQLAGSSIVGENARGQKARIYVTPSLEAKFVDSSSGRSTQYELLKNGILCTKQSERRFCYRVYVTGDDLRITYADGTPEFRGKITKGNIFTS